MVRPHAAPRARLSRHDTLSYRASRARCRGLGAQCPRGLSDLILPVTGVLAQSASQASRDSIFSPFSSSPRPRSSSGQHRWVSGFLGFDVLDVQGDVSALTNCGGFDDVFAREELSPLGLLTDLTRANEIRHGLRAAYPNEPHAECHVWAIWREETSRESPSV